MDWNERTRKFTVTGLSVLFLSMPAFPASASPFVFNGSFENVATSTGSSFLMTPGNATEVPNWVTNSGASFVLFPGTATTVVSGISLWPGCAPGSTVLNCLNPVPFPFSSPDGGNFIAVDGIPSLSGTLSQTLTGLVPGQSYNVTFYQAAGQLNDQRDPNALCCSGLTTEQWRVSLSDVAFGGTTTETHRSALMENASQSFVPWQSQTLTFQASSATAVLGFFAEGTPSGVPPFVLLDGVSISSVPEPTTFTLLGLGLVGVLLTRRARRAPALGAVPVRST